MSVYFSSSKLCFIPGSWKDDGTYTNETWPSDAILLTQDECDAYWKAQQPEGMRLGASPEGRPIWVNVQEPDITFARALSKLNEAYSVERLTLCSAWLVAAVADGTSEGARKADVEAELEEMDAQHELDVADLKNKYGVE